MDNYNKIDSKFDNKQELKGGKFDLSLLLREDLRDLVPYEPHVIPDVIKLDANENPFPPPREVTDLVKGLLSGDHFTRYPDPLARELLSELSLYTGVPADNILTGNGSDELIFNLVNTFGRERNVLVAAPTFSMYGIHGKIAGAKVVEVPRDKNFNLDLEVMHRAVENFYPAIVFLCSPNNPTGNATSPGEIEELLKFSKALVVVDEAYVEFGGESCISLLETYPNLVVLRTFSKAFGLAGLRVGYLLAGHPVIRELLRVKQPYNVNNFSQLAALAALKNRSLYKGQLAEIMSGRNVLMQGLKEIEGVEVYPSVANFILFRTSRPASEIFKGLIEEGVLIRNVDGPALESCLRVTVGTEQENSFFLEKLKIVVKNVK